MTASDLSQASTCARQTMELLPVLRRWVTARVHVAGVDTGLSLRQYAALRGICDGASSPGELARLWQVTPAVITGVIDRLERQGLVQRDPVPEDRRRLRLALTDAGIQASKEVEWALTGDLAAQLATAAPDELAELGRAIELLQRTFAALDARPPRPVPASPGDDMPGRDDDAVTNEMGVSQATGLNTVPLGGRSPGRED
ncbi:MAG: MarR family transcriptional regulator [Chloroflexia bacterium]|nr:MarR family transcriptional regulator [Chloroflexia bacterium]